MPTPTAPEKTIAPSPPAELQPRLARRLAARVARPARLERPILEGGPVRALTRREGLYRRALVCADALCALALVFAVLPLMGAHAPVWLALVAVPGLVLLAKLMGLYERDELVLKKTTLDEAPGLLQTAALTALGFWLTLDGATPVELDASDVLGVWTSSFALLVCGRVAARYAARRASDTERCFVIGERASIAAVADKLRSGRVNAEVVASLAVDDPAGGRRASRPLALEELVNRYRVHRVVIAPAAGRDAGETLELIRAAKHAGVRVSVLPRMFEVVGSAVEFDHLDGLTMLGIRRFGLSRSSRWLKRGFDLAGSSVLIGLMSPLMLAIALAVRLGSRGPVLFRQTRVGKDGRRFEMLKFRSMVEGADAQKDALRGENEAEGLFKIAEDPRITRVGRGLRKTSLDELPQLFNVWRGEMSLVGPRPLVVEEDQQVRGLDRQRLHLTPGMTGHWQILGSARIPLHEMVGIDYLYVANWSLWTDVKILLRTIPYMLATRGM